MRRLSIGRVALSSAALFGVSAFSLNAAAQNCDPTTLMCSIAEVKQHLESTDRLPTGIDTGWLPKCSGTPAPNHCSGEKIQFHALIAFDPPNGDAPVYVVDMPKGAVVQVDWPDTSAFVVSLAQQTMNTGTFRVSHSLTPEIGLYIDTPIYTGELNLNASSLVNYIPGAQFNYFATGSQTFAPWGFEPVAVKVKGNDLNNSKLFGVTFEQLAMLVGTTLGGVAKGNLSLNATTDSDFIYTTTAVNVIGATGPIAGKTDDTQLPMQDADYLEFTTQTEGVIRYTGTIEVLPVISITEIAGVGVSLNFPISVGLDFPYQDMGFPVKFPTTQVHVPLPNVFVPSVPLDYGTVQTGDRKEKSLIVDNTGEMGALLTFASSDSQFSPKQVSATMGPQDTYTLAVTFRPTKSGQQRATITVTSNDPDTPVQTFEVFGNGEGADIPDPGTGGSGGMGAGGMGTGGSGTAAFESASDDGGCGCKVPTQGSTSQGAAGLLALGLGLAFARRRRNKQS